MSLAVLNKKELSKKFESDRLQGEHEDKIESNYCTTQKA